MLSPQADSTHAALLFVMPLLAALLTASPASGQEPPPPPAAPESESNPGLAPIDAPPPPPPVDDLDAREAPPPDDAAPASDDGSDAETPEYWNDGPREPQPAKRISLEGLGGLGGMAGGYLVGGFGGAIVGAVINPDPFSVFLGAVIGAGTGGLLGTPLGIWGAGNAVDGRGNYWTTLGGTTLGFIGAAALSAAVQDTAPGVGTIGSIALPITGGIIAYELSNRGQASSAELGGKGMRLNAGIGQPDRGRGALLLFGASW
jgi:hypothetical protein